LPLVSVLHEYRDGLAKLLPAFHDRIAEKTAKALAQSARCDLLRSTRKMGETVGDPRDPEAMVKAFLQYKIMEQMQDYLNRGRRFAKDERLSKDWIIAVRSWLAHKRRAKERTMGDLAAELRLRARTTIRRCRTRVSRSLFANERGGTKENCERSRPRDWGVHATERETAPVVDQINA
jgi:hypothetical protein